MNFNKHLRLLIEIIEETIPEWRDKFVSYKALKKWLKKKYSKDLKEINADIAAVAAAAANDLHTRPSKRPRLSDGDNKNEMDGGNREDGGGGGGAVEEEVTNFEELLEKETDKCNDFFLEKQQDYVINLKILQERVAETKNSSEELMQVGRELVDFHGQIVLLENYSALNFLGLVKISKKHDKQSGTHIRSPFIQKLMQQPFFKTDTLNTLAQECERMLLHCISTISASFGASEDKESKTPDNEGEAECKEKLRRVLAELARSGGMDNIYVRLTSSALEVLKRIRSRSSTQSEYSLPPM